MIWGEKVICLQSLCLLISDIRMLFSDTQSLRSVSKSQVFTHDCTQVLLFMFYLFLWHHFLFVGSAAAGARCRAPHGWGAVCFSLCAAASSTHSCSSSLLPHPYCCNKHKKLVTVRWKKYINKTEMQSCGLMLALVSVLLSPSVWWFAAAGRRNLAQKHQLTLSPLGGPVQMWSHWLHQESQLIQSQMVHLTTRIKEKNKMQQHKIEKKKLNRALHAQLRLTSACSSSISWRINWKAWRVSVIISSAPVKLFNFATLLLWP